MNINTESDKQNLIDEQFCLSFELKAMADLLIRHETERWVTGFSDISVEKEHVSRYKWISKFVKGKRVLDIACGSGKGSYILADEGNAREVIGCDLDSNAIKYASIRNKHSKVSFIHQDALKYEDIIKYDAIVSFETIEHLPNVDVFLNRISGLLVPEGRFYVSTPISKVNLDCNPANPYHIQEWGFNEFQSLISKYFTIEEIYVQMREDRYPINFWLLHIKQKLQYIFKRNAILVFKEKFLNKNMMNPIKFDSKDNMQYESYYGIVGLQILVVKKK